MSHSRYLSRLDLYHAICSHDLIAITAVNFGMQRTRTQQIKRIHPPNTAIAGQITSRPASWNDPAAEEAGSFRSFGPASASMPRLFCGLAEIEACARNLSGHDRDAVTPALFRIVVPHRVMLARPIVPDQQRIRLPVHANLQRELAFDMPE